MNMPNKLECLSLASLSSLLLCNSLAYLADSFDTKKIKYCDYDYWDSIHNTSFSSSVFPGSPF